MALLGDECNCCCLASRWYGGEAPGEQLWQLYGCSGLAAERGEGCLRMPRGAAPLPAGRGVAAAAWLPGDASCSSSTEGREGLMGTFGAWSVC